MEIAAKKIRPVRVSARLRVKAWMLVVLVALGGSALWLGIAEAGPRSEDDRRIDFGREVRPILSDKCFFCHGPDENQREADLRLDRKEAAFRDLGGYFAIVPGKSADSELYLRISDPDDPMPPAESTKELTPAEIETLRAWIDQGADWEEHWSFVPPRRTEVPKVSSPSWARGPVDSFVLSALDGVGLQPEREASKETLLRRVTLDLTGLPPTLPELDAFLADDSADAYERVVDRLLSSSRYGEHMARAWLDAARYGDTHGLHLDNERSMWPYRDWVISAFNQNMPFDRFTIEQLAGDLLPNATLDQRVATGFNRCTPTSAEGGMIAAEYLVKYAVERVETTSTVWMGMTMVCAQCHDHKFDPISQKEFYEFYAFFNNITESASDGNGLAPPPVVRVPSAEQRAELEELERAIASTERALSAPMPKVDARQEEWERAWSTVVAQRWKPLKPTAFHSEGGATLRLLEDGSLLAEGENPDREGYVLLARTEATGISAIKLEALPHESLALGGTGRAENANFVLTEFELSAVGLSEPGAFEEIPVTRAVADFAQDGFPIERTLDGDDATGWAIQPERPEKRTALFLPEGPIGDEAGSLLRIRLGFDSQFARHAIGRLRLSVATDPALQPASFGDWSAVGPLSAASGDEAFDTPFGPETDLASDAAFGAEGLRWRARPDLVDGEIHRFEGENCATYLHRTIHAPNARTLELSLGSDDAIKVWVNGEAVLDERVARGVAPDQNRVTLPLRAGDNELVFKVVNFGGEYGFTVRWIDEAVGGLPVAVADVLGRPSAERAASDDQLLRDYFRRRESPAWKAIADELTGLRAQMAELESSIPLTLVMEEREEPRPANKLIRGRYDDPAEEVLPGVPTVLPPLPATLDERANRLDLARWLTDPAHPLTARVTVNRYWQRYFGHGLVATPEDFGSQGRWPTHPELLDWLAVEFVESGWDVKHLQRLLVTSSTYRQAASTNTHKRAADPNNRLYSRGPRFRLDAESVRDSALFIGGLLVEKVGGPSVRPYQPPGIWQAVAYTSSNTAKFQRDTGADLYRRSMYTFWKRTAPPPTMQIFDAPSREACTVNRPRTNTPLQALALMNDVQFVEAARAFAQRILGEGPPEDAGRIEYGFRLATSRRPTSEETDLLVDLLSVQRTEYEGAPEQAGLLLEVGESAFDETLDPAELAAWTHVASLILNLDETVTKG